MKGFQYFFTFLRKPVLLSLILGSPVVYAQQNTGMFFMHALPESNFVNPAIRQDCGLFIGLPVISSVHINEGNSGFTLNQLLNKSPDGTYVINPDFLSDRMPRHNIFTSELHTTILALGLRRDERYYTFSVIEKDNLSLFYTRDIVALALRGNSQFEGEWINTRGMGILFDHMREYALGISWPYSNRLLVGVKAKLLFGKLNITTGNSMINMFTEQNTLNLAFDIDAGFHSSLPYALEQDYNGNYRLSKRYDASLASFLMNPRNPGLAFDLGFIYDYNDRITLSGSLLDLGMVYYGSNQTNYSISGQYLYQGPLSDTTFDENYFWDIFDALNNNLDERISYRSYIHVLDPRLYLGASYRLSNSFNFNVLLYNHFYRQKIQNGLMISLLTHPGKDIEASLSWSYMYKSIANVGIGLVAGTSPLQVYFVSDNILSIFKPTNTKYVNLRFGLNIKISCRDNFNVDQCGCSWLKDAEDRRTRLEKFRLKLKKDKGN
jgi:hypothetical protein